MVLTIREISNKNSRKQALQKSCIFFPLWDPRGGSMDPLGSLGGTDGTWASRTPDTSSEDTSSESFIDTRPGPAGRPGPEPLGPPNHLARLVQCFATRRDAKTLRDFARYATLRDATLRYVQYWLKQQQMASPSFSDQENRLGTTNRNYF